MQGYLALQEMNGSRRVSPHFWENGIRLDIDKEPQLYRENASRRVPLLYFCSKRFPPAPSLLGRCSLMCSKVGNQADQEAWCLPSEENAVSCKG